MLALKPISCQERVLGGVAAVSGGRRRRPQLGQHPQRGRVVGQRIVLGNDVQRRRWHHVGSPVGDRLAARRRTRRSGRPRRRTAASARARTATWPPAMSAADASARVDSITAIRSSKLAPVNCLGADAFSQDYRPKRVGSSPPGGVTHLARPCGCATPAPLRRRGVRLGAPASTLPPPAPAATGIATAALAVLTAGSWISLLRRRRTGARVPAGSPAAATAMKIDE